MESPHRHPSTNIAETLPPPIQQTLGPEWWDACQALGYSPTAYQGYRPPAVDWGAQEERAAQLEQERRERREQLDAAFDWLLAVIGHSPERVRQALGAARIAPIERYFYDWRI